MEWISVKDRLPDFGQWVLEYRDLGDSEDYNAICWNMEDEKYYELNCITHWIPLPEPPKTK